jgi:hypothetical protein
VALFSLCAIFSLSFTASVLVEFFWLCAVLGGLFALALYILTAALHLFLYFFSCAPPPPFFFLWKTGLIQAHTQFHHFLPLILLAQRSAVTRSGSAAVLVVYVSFQYEQRKLSERSL